MNQRSPKSVASIHYQTLRNRILSGEILPGQILYESTLATELGASRTPIREALTLLESEGLLRRARRGYQIYERTEQEILDYFDVRNALESTSAELAAVRASELDRLTMVTLLDQARETSDPTIRGSIHEEWHRTLIRSSRNSALIDFVARAETLISLHRKPWESSIAGTDQSQREHEEILHAVLDHDPELARSLMLAHMSRARDYQLQLLATRELGGLDSPESR